MKMNCSQLCPYNTLKGCKAKEMNKICPLTNVAHRPLKNPEQLVKTNDILFRGKKRYEVVIADDNIFVICPTVYSRKEKSRIVKYTKAEIYANQSSINTLLELGFDAIDRRADNDR